jgi:hypothetical protein
LVLGVFLLVSHGITVLSTGLIIYRIISLSRDTWGERNRYRFTIEILLESGALYAVTLLIDAVLVLFRWAHPDNGALWMGATYWSAVIPPIAVCDFLLLFATMIR